MRPLTRRRGRQIQDDRGQTLLEFALASVVFFITVFGTIEFGLAIYRYNMLSDLAQEGARWAAVHGSTSTLTPAGTAANLQAFVQSRAPGFTVVATATPTANPSGTSPGQIITVRVTSTFAPVTSFIPGATLNLESTARMTVFR